MADYARPKLWAPLGVGHEARADEAELMSQVFSEQYIRALYEPDLKAIDPALELRKAQDTVTPGNGLKPGYWHIIRHEPGFVSYVTPLEYPDGSPREPGSWMYEHLAKEDMWSNRSVKAAHERNRKLMEARAREEERERQDRVGDFNERYAAANRVQILVPRGVS